MKKIKLNIHSVIDLITNSSTEIFSNFSNSVEPCKELINEIFRLFHVEKTCEDVFDIYLENEDKEDIPATLCIVAKDRKYTYLAECIQLFLESGESKEFMG